MKDTFAINNWPPPIFPISFVHPFIIISSSILSPTRRALEIIRGLNAPQSQKKRHNRFWQARWLQMAIVTVRLHTIWGLTMELREFSVMWLVFFIHLLASDICHFRWLEWEQMMPLRSFTVTRHHYPCGTCWPHLAANYTAVEPWYQTEILRALSLLLLDHWTFRAKSLSN